MDEEDFKELISQAEKFIPLIPVVVPLIKKAGVEISPLIESLADYTVDLQIRVFKRCMKKGFTREEAFLSSLSFKAALAKMGENHNKVKK